MPSILLSRSVAGIIHEHAGQSGQGNGRHAAGFPSNANPAFFPSITDETASLRTKRCHGRVIHSRNPEDTGGHKRTRRWAKLRTGGHWRNRRDTRGHLNQEQPVFGESASCAAPSRSANLLVRGGAIKVSTKPFAVPVDGGYGLTTPIGDPIRVKATTLDTAGSLTIIEFQVAPNNGPGVHIHFREDEL